MIDAGSLVFQGEKTLRLAQRGTDAGFLGIQLVGSDLPTLKRAAEIVNGMDFDVLDFNLGCPAPKVARKCEGIRFALENPDGAVRALETLVSASRLPVTVKTRIQDENDSAPTVAFCRRLQDAGAQAVTIHGRLMRNFYSGPVFYKIIAAVRESLSIPVIANGGAMDGESFRALLRETGCAAGMVARGALGNPWIFREIADPSASPPDVEEFTETIRLYMADMLDCYGPEFAYVVARKSLLEFLRGRGYPGALRASVSFLDSADALERLLDAVAEGPTERYTENLALHPESVERKLVRSR
jgi:tRNA-dihydrouridine synthase B